jgi:hypothetical protein
MILIHVLYLTSANAWLKQVTTYGTLLGVVLDLVSPWFITYVHPVFALSMLAGDTLMTLGFLVLFSVPMYEMWGLGQPLVARGGD